MATMWNYTIVCAAHARSCTDPQHMPPHVHVYRFVAMSVKHSPRILLPTDSVANIRKKDDMLGDGNSIDTAVDPTSADAHEGACPPEVKNTDADASQNCVDADADTNIWIETPSSYIPFPTC